MKRINRPLPAWATVLGMMATAAVVLAGSALAGSSSGIAGNFKYVSETGSVDTADVHTNHDVFCGESYRVTGGGVDPFGGVTATDLFASEPVDSDDSGDVPDDGWYVALDNNTGGSVQYRVFAICRKRGSG